MKSLDTTVLWSLAPACWPRRFQGTDTGRPDDLFGICCYHMVSGKWHCKICLLNLPKPYNAYRSHRSLTLQMQSPLLLPLHILLKMPATYVTEAGTSKFKAHRMFASIILRAVRAVIQSCVSWRSPCKMQVGRNPRQTPLPARPVQRPALSHSGQWGVRRRPAAFCWEAAAGGPGPPGA